MTGSRTHFMPSLLRVMPPEPMCTIPHQATAKSDYSTRSPRVGRPHQPHLPAAWRVICEPSYGAPLTASLPLTIVPQLYPNCQLNLSPAPAEGLAPFGHPPITRRREPKGFDLTALPGGGRRVERVIAILLEELELEPGRGHGSAGQADFKYLGGRGIVDLGEQEGRWHSPIHSRVPAGSPASAPRSKPRR